VLQVSFAKASEAESCKLNNINRNHKAPDGFGGEKIAAFLENPENGKRYFCDGDVYSGKKPTTSLEVTKEFLSSSSFN